MIAIKLDSDANTQNDENGDNDNDNWNEEILKVENIRSEYFQYSFSNNI